MTERIRYYPKGSPKNTLVTIDSESGDFVYFGISRCNQNAGDTVNKQLGKKIARGRAVRATKDVVYGNAATFYLDMSGLRGFCKKSNIQDLLNYFDNVDLHMREER